MSFAANLPLFSVVGCLLASAVSAVLRAKPAAWVDVCRGWRTEEGAEN